MAYIHRLLTIITFTLMSVYSTGLYASDVAGRVVDAVTKRPIPFSNIRIWDRNDRLIFQGETDEAGEYRFSIDYTGVITVSSISNGYASLLNENVRLIEGKSQTVNFSLSRSTNAIEEIMVTAQATSPINNGSVAGRILSREEIRRTPGTAGDVFRGLNSLPGVNATGAYSSFSVRGRGPRDNIILIDQIPYDRAVHFDQSLGQEEDIGGGGRFSIFGQNVIGQAEFSPGGWGSAYGGANGSLLKLDIAEGNTDTPFMSGKLDLAGGELLYDGPSYAFDNTSVLLSMRYYDFGQLFDIIGAKEIGRPVLADFLFKSNSRINDRTNLKVIALYTPEKYTRGINNVIASPDFEDPMLFNSKQEAGMAGITLERLIGDVGRWTNIVYFRKASDNSSQGEAFPIFGIEASSEDDFTLEKDIISLRENEKEIGWRSDYENNNALGRYTAGIRLTYNNIDFKQNLSRDYPLFIFDTNDTRPDQSQKYIVLSQDQFNLSFRENSIKAVAFYDQKIELENVILTVGGRLEYDDIAASSTLSPRFQADWQLTGRIRTNMTLGLYYQAPRLLEIAANLTNASLRHERTAQASFGFEYALSPDYTLQTDLYYQDLSNLIPNSDQVTGLYNNSGTGYAYGLDTILHKRFSNRWSASLRYSYNNSSIKDSAQTNSHPTQFSRPHLGNLTVYYELNDRWSFGLQYQISSGRPANDFIIHEDVYSELGLNRFSREITNLYTSRFPSFQTVNFRVDYRKQFNGFALKGFVDIVNALGRQNIDEVDFSPITGRIDTEGLGVFPQIGLSIEF